MSDSDAPPAPPPTLVTDVSTSKSYNRHFLLSLATPQAHPPNPERVMSFSKLLRTDSGRWGEDESASELLDGSRGSSPSTITPVTKLPIEPVKEVLFDFKTPGETPAPVLVDFTTPDPFIPTKDAKVKASNIFQSFPGTRNVSKESLVSAGEVAHSLGDKFQTLRLGARLDSIDLRSRSPSLGSNDTHRLSRASSISSESGKLNVFAAPWPLPNTTPRIPISGGVSPATSSPSLVASLPLPKISALPAGLPAKPNVTLPPVFVKRETAALPQSMALPDVSPLGKDWEGENSLSGNDKRRRASELGFAPLPLPRASLVEGMLPKSLKEDARPERLVRMGQNWRASVSGHGERLRS